MNMRQVFLIEMSEEHKWEFLILTPPATVGRNSGCDVAISDESISGEHARIFWDNGQLVCQDLDTTNGTRVNGSKIAQEIIRDGDLLNFGKLPFMVRIGSNLPCLYVPDREKVLALGMLPFMLGRATSNHLALTGETSISTRHAAICQEQNTYFIKDYQSTNGTRVNGTRIQQQNLHDGDQVQLGKWSGIFLCEHVASAGYSIRFLTGERAGEVIPVKEKLSIGRDASNLVSIADSKISNQHAAVFWSQGHYWLEDLKSSAGTRLDGVNITRVPLRHGQEICMAEQSFLFFDKDLPAEKFYLVWVDGAQGGEEIELTQKEVVFGRDASCQICIAATQISSQHAKLIAQQGSFLLQDLQSTNGTLVNGRKITSVVLQHGDEIQIGWQKLVFRSSARARPNALQHESFVLLPLTAKGYGQPIALNENFTIGRLPDNTLVLKEPYISSHHATITHEEDGYHIHDNASTIGTVVNEHKVSNVKLEHGDEIVFGQHRYIFKNSLRPLATKHAMNVPYWLLGTAAAAVVLIALSLLFFFPTFQGKPVSSAHKLDKPEPKPSPINDNSLLAECRQKIAKARSQYLYHEAMQLLGEYQKRLGMVANRQTLEAERPKLEKEAAFFADFVLRLQAPAVPIQIELEDKGQCVLEKADSMRISLRPLEMLLPLELTWEELPRPIVYTLLDATGLSREKPCEAAEMAIGHQELNAAEKYLVDAFDRFPDKRQEVTELYAKAFNMPVPPGGFLLHQGRLISQAQKDALDKAEQELRSRWQEQAVLSEKQKAEQLAKQREPQEFPLRYNIINDFVRTYSFAKAIEQLRKLEQELYAPDLKQKVQARIQEIEPLAQLFDRMIQGINNGSLVNADVPFGSNVTGRLVAADREQFRIKVPRGEMKVRWYSLPPQRLYNFLSRLDLTGNEHFLLGVFCFENDIFDDGNRTLVKCLEKSPEHKDRIDQYLAQKLGIPMPEGGFVPFQGTLISKDEKEKRQQGMVRYKGKWVTPADKENLAAGFIQHDGKWVTPDEKKMLQLGYIRYQDKWYSKEELTTLRTNWDHAWTHETQHYDIRCNISEAFTQELGCFLEAACEEFAKFFVAKDGRQRAVHTRMNVYAFRSYEDYRTYCLKTGNSAQLRAGGFATNMGNLAVGWMRDEPKHILATMIHEGAHLYHYNAYPNHHAPSWFAEGVATQFEGYEWDGKVLKVNFISSERLRWLQRAFLRNQYIPIRDLLDGNALEHINKDAESAANFYAECWGLYYFLSRAGTQDYQSRFQEFTIQMNNGSLRGRERSAFLDSFEKDLATIETTWRNHILKMD
jgi:pSer/pThr/pTyr-binding forkhead associated (FHA) protein